MWKRLKSEQQAAEDVVDSSDKADRLEAEMRVIKDDLDEIRTELGDRIEEVRRAIDEALTA